MKKHDEGYALVLVVVVMAVLMLVALSVMSLSLRNLQSQQASIERMQAKYAAQGKVEIIQAELEALAVADIANQSTVKDVIDNRVKNQVEAHLVSEPNYDWENGEKKCTFSVFALSDNGAASCTITCTIQLTEENGAVKVTYLSYTISTETTGGGGE